MSEPARRREEKARLRSRMRDLLRGLDADEREARGRRVLARVEGLEAVRRARNVLLFRSIEGEIDTGALFTGSLARGQAVFFPRLDGEQMVFYRATGDTPWRSGPFSTLEPDSTEPLLPEHLDHGATVVIVPGLAFSERGERLGRGGGHYDRALGAAPLAGRIDTIGLAFEIQVLARLPVEEHDVGVDVVVTEERIAFAAAFE